MSESSDNKPQIRISDENRKWMDGYRKLIGYNTPYTILANMLMEKGRDKMPTPKKQGGK